MIPQWGNSVVTIAHRYKVDNKLFTNKKYTEKVMMSSWCNEAPVVVFLPTWW